MKCVCTDDPLLNSWDAIEIPAEWLENEPSVEPIVESSGIQRSSAAVVEPSGIQRSAAGCKISFGPPKMKINRKGKETATEEVPNTKGKQKKSLGLINTRKRKYITRSSTVFKSKFYGNNDDPIYLA